jgi:hypothetical protein
MTRVNRLLLAVLLLAFASSSFAQEEHAYTEGTVTNISYVKIKPGMFDAYMNYLQTTYKQIMEEQKKAGIVVSYGIYQAFARSPKEADLYLTTTFKNWAALDGLTDRTDAITRKVWGTLQKSDEAAIDREKLREILGQEIVQELILK